LVELLQREIHARAIWVHLAACDLRAKVFEDQAAEDMQRGVGAHHAVTKFPVHCSADGGVDRRDSALYLMPDAIALVIFGQLCDLVFPSIPAQDALIGHLTASAGVESGAVKSEGIFMASNDSGIEIAKIAVGMIQEISVHQSSSDTQESMQHTIVH